MNKNQKVVTQCLRSLGIKANVTSTRGGHLRIQSPQLNRILFTGASPSDVRALKNLKSDIDKARIR